MINKTPRKRKWTKEEVNQWYQDTGAFTYANPKVYLLLGVILAIVFIVVYFIK